MISTRFTTSLGAILLGSSILAVCGCSSPSTEIATVKFTGKITQNGQPLTISPANEASKAGKVEVILYPYTEEKGKMVEPNYAYYQSDGQFVVESGVPAGKYRITVAQWDPYPQKDLLKGGYGKENSPIVHEIKGGENLDIDLSKIPPGKLPKAGPPGMTPR